MRAGRIISAVGLVLLASCVQIPPPGIGEPISWQALPGWQEDYPRAAWPALLAGCRVVAGRGPQWKSICDDAALINEPDDIAARAFFETRFTPHVLYGEQGSTEGLITGYYEPLLHGSRTRTERFRFPVYGRPDDLLIVDLGEIYPELKGKRLRGRLDGKRVVPYYSRAQIENTKKPATPPPVVWVDDQVALFFLHIQGSGRVQLTDGQTLYLGYADQNGHPYRAIGRRLIDAGVPAQDVSMQAIREWLLANPTEMKAVLESNPSYVFFEERTELLPGPVGSLNVPLYAERAVAIDPAFVPLGLPVWLDTALPGDDAPYRRLMFAHDTGGAIRGAVRADIFFGFGENAEARAGRMKQPGRIYVLLPITQKSQ